MVSEFLEQCNVWLQTMGILNEKNYTMETKYYKYNLEYGDVLIENIVSD